MVHLRALILFGRIKIRSDQVQKWLLLSFFGARQAIFGLLLLFQNPVLLRHCRIYAFTHLFLDVSLAIQIIHIFLIMCLLGERRILTSVKAFSFYLQVVRVNGVICPILILLNLAHIWDNYHVCKLAFSLLFERFLVFCCISFRFLIDSV